MEQVSYDIDRHDEISGVRGSWNEFARSNDASQLAAQTVVGRPLWHFVAGDETRHVYEDLIRRVRTGKRVAFSYRCDSPALRRFMRMTMTPADADVVEFDSVTLRTETRPPVALLAAPAVSDGMLHVCSWCKQVLVDGEWAEVEVAVERLGLFAGGPLPSLTHGMCPTCLAKMMVELDRR